MIDNAPTESMSFSIRVSNPSSVREQKYQVFLPFREGRGLIDDPEVLPAGTGYSIVFEADDGLLERIGDDLSPIPKEVIDAMRGPAGVLFINLGDEGDVADGQLLSL